MKHTSIIIFVGHLLLQTSFALGQDSSKAILSDQWFKVSNAQLNLSQGIIDLCYVRDVQRTYYSKSAQLVSIAKGFSKEVMEVSILDSGLVVHLDKIQDSLLIATFTFVRMLQENRILFKNPSIRTAGKKVEYMVEELGRQIHDFNYWINEKNRLNIWFRDIAL